MKITENHKNLQLWCDPKYHTRPGQDTDVCVCILLHIEIVYGSGLMVFGCEYLVPAWLAMSSGRDIYSDIQESTLGDVAEFPAVFFPQTKITFLDCFDMHFISGYAFREYLRAD